MQEEEIAHGIADGEASDLASDVEWIDELGRPREAVKLTSRKNKQRDMSSMTSSNQNT